MTLAPAVPAAVTVLGLIGLLVADYVGSVRGRWCTKPVAAAGFVAVALTAGATGTPHGTWILLGLVLSFVGDLLLLPSDRPGAFKAGLVCFLMAHLAYGVAFLQFDLQLPVAGTLAGVCTVIGVFVLRWLAPHLPGDLRVPMLAYVVVISTMLVLAASASLATGRFDLLAGAFLFYVSDISVARKRFVAPGFANAAWGLPAYFIGQLILAWGSGT